MRNKEFIVDFVIILLFLLFLVIFVVLVLLQDVVVCLAGVQDDVGIRVEVPRRIFLASGSRFV